MAGVLKRAGPLGSLSLITALFAVRAIFLTLALPFGDPLDELYHAGYAAFLAKSGHPPRSAESSMPGSLLRAASLLPYAASGTAAWGRFAAMPAFERQRIRTEALGAAAENGGVGGPNYESQQPPLSYLFAAGLCRIESRASVASRLLSLRLLAGLFATAAIPVVYLALTCVLPRAEALAAAAACAFFPGLGIFAGRWTNDALALPLAAAVLLGLFWCAWGRLTLPRAAVLALVLAGGLWTKLYFLPLVPAVPIAAFLSPRSRRKTTVRRATLSAGLALVALLPWLLRQTGDTGSWLGVMASKKALEAGVGWSDRLRAFPGLLRARALGGYALSFVWPGTSSYMGPNAAMRVLLAAGFAVLLAAPFLARRRRARSRRTWVAGLLAVASFLGAQAVHESTFLAAIRRLRLRESVSLPGWYLLILLPVVLTSGVLSGRRPSRLSFAVACVFFFCADLVALFGLLPAVFSGAGEGLPWLELAPGSLVAALESPLRSLRVYGQVGLGSTPLIAACAVGWIGLSAAALLRLARSR